MMPDTTAACRESLPSVAEICEVDSIFISTGAAP